MKVVSSNTEFQVILSSFKKWKKAGHFFPKSSHRCLGWTCLDSVGEWLRAVPVIWVVGEDELQAWGILNTHWDSTFSEIN